jgi:site-specific DNA-methyltransferase (adenine-specific)
MQFANKIILGDCREVMQDIPADSIAACITDPPYNYEFIGRQWDAEEIKRRVGRVKESKTLVKNIPYGSGLAGGVRNANWYKRNRENILEYQEWCYEWAVPLFRILKSGAFVLVFNSTRTNAHVQVALERAGFYARDVLVWRRHAGIPKGFNGKQMAERTGDNWDGWHSCLRNEWEAICVLQKPLINNYPETLATTGVGLMHAQNGDGNFASNIIEGISNRNKIEDAKVHCTVKPLDLMKRLIELVVPPDPNHVVLDPFAGSGTTLVAAKELGRRYLGIELVPEYCDHVKNRLSGCMPKPKEATNQAKKPAMLFE